MDVNEFLNKLSEEQAGKDKQENTDGSFFERIIKVPCREEDIKTEALSYFTQKLMDIVNSCSSIDMAFLITALEIVTEIVKRESEPNILIAAELLRKTIKYEYNPEENK